MNFFQNGLGIDRFNAVDVAVIAVEQPAQGTVAADFVKKDHRTLLQVGVGDWRKCPGHFVFATDVESDRNIRMQSFAHGKCAAIDDRKVTQVFFDALQ